MTVRHKFFLRNLFRQFVRALPASRRRRDSRRVARRLFAWPPFKQAATVALYLARPYEIDTRFIINECRRRGKTLAVPVVVPGKNRMRFVRLPVSGGLAGNVYGILEPVAAKRFFVKHDAIDFCVVPGAAFTPKCDRVGSGSGYYDRWLKKWRGYAVGLAFDCQIAVRLPRDRHDIRLHAVITPSRVYRR